MLRASRSSEIENCSVAASPPLSGTIFPLTVRCRASRPCPVYPPGSVVQLSNQALASVISVNSRKPLRPWVLLYDENVDKSEAMMLNLELEPELNIVKSIRPGLLPAKIAAYLNPRRRVTYFFDTGTDGNDLARKGALR